VIFWFKFGKEIGGGGCLVSTVHELKLNSKQKNQILYNRIRKIYEKAGLAIMLQTCIQEVLGLNLGRALIICLIPSRQTPGQNLSWATTTSLQFINQTYHLTLRSPDIDSIIQ
jgi:hypothetical protein